MIYNKLVYKVSKIGLQLKNFNIIFVKKIK